MSTATLEKPRRRALFRTFGCRLNQAETAMLADHARAAGYEVVDEPRDVTLCVINTCTVTHEADAKCRKAIAAVIRECPDAFVAITGCYSETGRERLARIPGVDLIVGNQHKLDLLAHVGPQKNPTPVIILEEAATADFSLSTNPGEGLSRRTNLKIQDGCDCRCAYCIIPDARGPARSRDLANLVEEAHALAARGVKEIILTGVNLAAYDNAGKTIVDVCDALAVVDGLARLRISSLEMTPLIPPLCERMADTAHILVPFLHLPLQSGSDAVLARMRRRYTRSEALRVLEDAARRTPGICLGTDLMVGMPGETEADFEATLDALQSSPLAYAHVFRYSERSGTPASLMPNKVSPRVMSARAGVLRRVSATKRRLFNMSFADAILPVLFESREKASWLGFTANYIRVAAVSDANLTNTIRPVRLRSAAGAIMIGDLI